MIQHFKFFEIQKELEVSCLGVALRLALPMIVGQKMTKFFELIKPMIEFKFEAIQSRGNNVFELATQEEIDKLGSTNKGSSSHGQFTDDIDLDEVWEYLLNKMICINTNSVLKYPYYFLYCISYPYFTGHRQNPPYQGANGLH